MRGYLILILVFALLYSIQTEQKQGAISKEIPKWLIENILELDKPTQKEVLSKMLACLDEEMQKEVISKLMEAGIEISE